MLNLPAQHRARPSWPAALPLPFSCLAADYPSPLLHYHSLRPFPHHSLLLRQHADSILSDPIHQLVLPRLPPLRNSSSSGAPRPRKSFCIEDILGRDPECGGQRRSSSSGRPGVSTSSAGRPLDEVNACRSLSCEITSCPLLSKVRALSTSPSTPTSTSSCPSPTDPPSSLSPLCAKGLRIVRPWIPDPSTPHTHASSDDGVDDIVVDDDEEEEEEEDDDDDDEEEEEINVDDEEEHCSQSGWGVQETVSRDLSPLDAIMALTSKTLTGMHCAHSAESRRRERQALLFSRQAGGPKKRRKSRTAFSNQQIYQLEKRFLYQKYLTPADRDDIAHTLGLSNSQVITWFQNRRAKLKRDLEELKNDVTAAKNHSGHRTGQGTAAERQTHRPHRHQHPHHRHHRHHPTPAKEPRNTDAGRRGAGGGGGGGGASLSPPSSSSSSRARAGVNSGTLPSSSSLTPRVASVAPGGCLGNQSNGDATLGMSRNKTLKDRFVSRPAGERHRPPSGDRLDVDDSETTSTARLQSCLTTARATSSAMGRTSDRWLVDSTRRALQNGAG